VLSRAERMLAARPLTIFDIIVEGDKTNCLDAGALKLLLESMVRGPASKVSYVGVYVGNST
jgi:hypothetical protein